jgi:hypothetical protein
MKANDLILIGLGVFAGYFFKSNWDKRNALSSENSGVNSLPSETNYVFSEKYKYCEAQANKTLSKINDNINYLEVRKRLIDDCMKDTGIR